MEAKGLGKGTSSAGGVTTSSCRRQRLPKPLLQAGKAFKTHPTSFPRSLPPSTESLHTNAAQAISSETSVSSVFPYRSALGGGGGVGGGVCFFKLKNLVFFLPGKMGFLASLPTAGEIFHCDFPFFSSPSPFGAETPLSKQAFKNVCWLTKEKGPISHFPRKSQKY